MATSEESPMKMKKLIVILCLSLTLSSATGRKHSTKQENRSPPTYDELGAAVAAGLMSLARTAHRPVSRLGIDVPLDPLHSSSELKYVNEGDLLRLKLVLDNVTLTGFKTLTVQEVTFKRPKDSPLRNPWAPSPGRAGVGVILPHYRGEEEEEGEEDEERDGMGGDDPAYDYSDDWRHSGDFYHYDDYGSLAVHEVPPPPPPPLPPQAEDSSRYREHHHYGDSHAHPPISISNSPTSSEGIIRVSFKQMSVKAKYQVRGSAGGFFTFRETGDLTLTSPTVFLTTRLNVTLPGFGTAQPSQKSNSRHGRVKVLWARSNVSIGSTSLLLQPEAHPPEWVRQQVQSKMEELSSDLDHGHGAIRLLLRRWGRLIKRLIHRTARSLTK